MNKHITAAALIIMLSGVLKAWASQTPITRVIIGGYVLLLILAILDLFGGPLSRLASAIAMLAVVYVLLNQFPWSTVLAALQGGGGAAGSSSQGGSPTLRSGPGGPGSGGTFA